MTKREFMQAVIAIATEMNKVDIKEFAESEISKLDARNAKRASKPSKTAQANEPIKKAIAQFLDDKDTPMTAKEIGESVEISTQKASALCRQMVESGLLNVTDVKVKGRGKQKGYSVA